MVQLIWSRFPFMFALTVSAPTRGPGPVGDAGGVVSQEYRMGKATMATIMAKSSGNGIFFMQCPVRCSYRLRHANFIARV